MFQGKQYCSVYFCAFHRRRVLLITDLLSHLQVSGNYEVKLNDKIWTNHLIYFTNLKQKWRVLVSNGLTSHVLDFSVGSNWPQNNHLTLPCSLRCWLSGAWGVNGDFPKSKEFLCDFISTVQWLWLNQFVFFNFLIPFGTIPDG